MPLRGIPVYLVVSLARTDGRGSFPRHGRVRRIGWLRASALSPCPAHSAKGSVDQPRGWPGSSVYALYFLQSMASSCRLGAPRPGRAGAIRKHVIPHQGPHHAAYALSASSASPSGRPRSGHDIDTHQFYLTKMGTAFNLAATRMTTVLRDNRVINRAWITHCV